MAVFAVIEQADSMVWLGKVHPLMGRHFEFCLIERVITISASLNRAVGNIIGSGTGDQLGMEAHFEQFLLFPPVHPGFKIEPLPFSLTGINEMAILPAGNRFVIDYNMVLQGFYLDFSCFLKGNYTSLFAFDFLTPALQNCVDTSSLNNS